MLCPIFRLQVFMSTSAEGRRCGTLLRLQLNRGTCALNFTQSVDGRVYAPSTLTSQKAGDSVTPRADNKKEP